MLFAFASCAPSQVDPPVEAALAGADAETAALIGRLLDAARQDPGDGDRRADLGMAYDVSGLVRAALASYEQAALLAPEQPRHRYLQAHARAQLGDLPAAVDALDAALSLTDDYVPAHVQHGQWLLELDRVDEASEAFERALVLEPNHPGGWLGRARVSLKRGEPEKAVEILGRLLQGRQHPYLYQMLGLAYRDAGQLENARAALANARPGAPPPSWPDPWLAARDEFRRGPAATARRAESLLSEGRYQEAIDLLEQPMREDPENRAVRRGMSMALHGIGRNLRQAGRYEDALGAINRAIEVGIPRVDLLLDAGALEASLGHWEHAANRFAQVVQLDPSLAAGHIGLGGSTAELGDFDAAAESFNRAEQLAPGNPAVEAARRRLAELRAGGP